MSVRAAFPFAFRTSHSSAPQLLMHRFDSGVLKCFSDSHSELRHLINRGLWCVRGNMADRGSAAIYKV